MVSCTALLCITTIVLSLVRSHAKILTPVGDTPSDGQMLELTPFNFNDHIGKKDVLVMFAMPDCGGCKKFKPEFDKLHNELGYLSETLQVMSANVTIFDYEELKGRLNISKVPAVRLFRKSAGPDAVPITIPPNDPWKMHFKVKEHLGLPVPNKCMFGDSEARDVTSTDWDKYVMDPAKTVIVEFFAPWCKHCQKFKPTYNLIANRANKLPKLLAVRVNADTSKDLMARFNVKMLPSFFMFPTENKTGTPFSLPKEWATSTSSVVQLVIDTMQMDPTLEAQALQLWEQLESSSGDETAKIIANIEHQQSTLNDTFVWKKRLLPALSGSREIRAEAIKQEVLVLVGKKQYTEALSKLENLQQSLGIAHL
jgi:thiol-disulfide isomerase/thioredoxin